MAVSVKPLLIISVTPVYGHVMPILAIGKELVARGYEVTFVTGSKYKEHTEDIGASLVALSGYGDFAEADALTKWPLRPTIPAGGLQFAWDMEHIFIKSIPSQYEAQQIALKSLQNKFPGRPIILMSEGGFFGSTAGMAGAPGIKPTATLSVGIVPVVLSSIDCAPFGLALPPDSSPDGRERNKSMTKATQEGLFGHAQTKYIEILKELGANVDGLPFFLDAMYTLPDRFLQLCIPSVEYPRSDAPSSIRFAGGLPKGHRKPWSDPPGWWHEIKTNKTKHVMLVSQGTVAMNFSDLIIPTMLALKDREDIIVVVALGKRGITLPEGSAVPSNARVADFIPFDEVLPYCTVFITNGGYGAFQHAVGNGVPLIIGGGTEDKPEIAARAEWAGVGVNLKTGTPTPEQILAAVEEVISISKYKKRALGLEAEMATFDPMEVVVKSIEELAASKC